VGYPLVFLVEREEDRSLGPPFPPDRGTARESARTTQVGRKERAINLSTRPRPLLGLCALVVMSVRLLFALEACSPKDEGQVRRQASRLGRVKQSPWYAALVGGIVGLLMLVGPAPALASNGWSAPAPVDPAFFNGSVSCPSAAFCAAVGDGGGGGDAATFNGSSWSAATGIDTFPLASVSCPSSSFCVAVDYSGNAVTFNGSSWSAPASIDPAGLLSVSCPSVSFCAAIGSNAVTFNGSSWSAPVSIDATNDLAAVSCASASFCTAVDYEGNAVTFDGSEWSAPVSIDTDGLSSVSCPSSSFCAAVGNFGKALTFDGVSWSSPKIIDTGPGLESVSCASSSFCTAVDSGGNALTYDGSVWSAPA
jgi:hypothetical protein